ncbi:MAG: DNA translocase FtsK [Bacteroidetes bacterium]|nr:DNA translocase FtsK [Bacteroidota bacterium]
MKKNTYKKEKIKKGLNLIPEFILSRKFQIILGFILQGLSIFLLISFISHLFNGKYDQSSILAFLNKEINNLKELEINNKLGILGALSSYYFIFKWFGITALVVPFFIYLIGHKLTYKKTPLSILKAFNIVFFSIIWTNLLLGYLQSVFEDINLIEFLVGGIGLELVTELEKFIGGGILIIIIVMFLIFLVYIFDITHIKTFNLPKFSLISKLKKLINRKSKKEENENNVNPIIETNSLIDTVPLNLELNKKEEVKNNDLTLKIEEPKQEEQNIEEPKNSDLKIKNYDPTLDLSRYKYPIIDLLKQHNFGNPKVSHEELEQNKNKIIETLINFKIGISSIKATIGPTVTLYEIIPEAGVKISKIKNLEDDIALNLAALGIRIIAPIPGKGTIGIEVPNKQREVVPFKSIVESDKFIKSKMDLPIIIGKTIANEVYVADLAQMPHLLIAGATGQGKSVGLNVVLASLLYKKHPSQLKFVLVDPKKVELSLYSKIERHFLAKLPTNGEAIITATKEVIHTLNSLCIEMDTRYELLKDAGARNIREYNKKFVERKLNPKQGHRFLPYIILVIDEFADMMMTAGKEIETPIARLAQLARAIGIHLVLATQRPSVNVITGIIKANFPVRISYKVSSKIDSRTILDAGGADQLVGKGDLLLSMNSEILRIQCPFIDTDEVNEICEYIGAQQGYGSAYSLPVYEPDSEKTESSNKEIGERDKMFEDAARLIVSHQQGSTSLIQRRLKLGYNRAGRLIDQLEAAGIVGPFEGSKARAVLIPDEHSLNLLLDNLEN